MEKVFKYVCQRYAYLSLHSDDNMIRVPRTCVLILVYTFLTQVESGYEYQIPRLILQPPNQHSILVKAGQRALTQQSVPYSSRQDNSNYIRHQNGQYLQNSYQNALNNYNPNNNGFENNVQSGSVTQNVHKTNSITVQPAQPIVTKHIYFHVPPPDEDRPVQAPHRNRKKTYNIVFIKLPNYFVNSLGVRSNPYAVVGDKTLIYVLVKNPEDQLQGLSKESPPNHEVYYVKYKGSAAKAASQINGDVSEQNSVQILKPGLRNGQLNL